MSFTQAAIKIGAGLFSEQEMVIFFFAFLQQPWGLSGANSRASFSKQTLIDLDRDRGCSAPRRAAPPFNSVLWWRLSHRSWETCL